ncbi:RNA polymerase sigma factor [Limnoglobus roseus]|uniref:RNA polymerase subunit sigma-24 n=1 Tax=Limnoglobus roseus TaxID=2598579 RepID=A0A5C1AG00_9BACT|nr:sigma-70 family RNA polymerase sigma factor [Limnoglobus roseus]QEL15908.1 RNA polymerase subunit sigma-24 [Limnoglobus roseus]
MGAPEPRADLIRRWQQGEPAAFETLVRTWEGPIGRFLYRLTRSAETARDLSQEVFTRVYQARHSYRDRGHFSTWIYRVALNLARDEARRSRRVTEPYPDHELACVGTAADGWAEQQETVAKVVAALGELSPSLREVVVLRYYEEFSFEEMGRLLETPASTLKSRFGVALRQLEDRLAAHGLRPEDRT